MILRLYLVKEIGLAFVATLFVLLLIIVGNTFVRLLGRVSDGNLPTDVLGELVLLGSLSGAIQLVPIALLIGMLLAFGRLYQDHEMGALNAAGAGPLELYKAIFTLVIPLTLLLAALVIFLVPKVETINHSIKQEVKQRPESTGIPQGEFIHSKKGDKEFTLFIEKLDEGRVVMKHFFMNIRSDNSETTVLAEDAILFIDPNSGERLLQVNNGSRYDRATEDNAFTIFRFREHGIRIPPIEVEDSIDLSRVSFLTLARSHKTEYKAEFHWRIAIILSAPIMALLAFPLSYSTPRQGRYGKLALGILLYAIYANLLIFGKSLLEQDKIPSILGLWWVHALFIALSLLMLWKQYGVRKKVST